MRRFGGRTAVDDVTFEVQAGEVFGLLGPNGAGKTTTLRMLGGLIAPTSGDVRVDGVTMDRASGPRLRARIGFLTETPGLWDQLTVADNIAVYARLFGLDGVPAAVVVPCSPRFTASTVASGPDHSARRCGVCRRSRPDNKPTDHSVMAIASGQRVGSVLAVTFSAQALELRCKGARAMETKLAGLLGKLTLEQKVGLLTGADFWSLDPIPEIGLRKILLSDGPNGVRGTAWDERETSLLFPNPSALAAIWDPGQAHRAGTMMGGQARDKGIAWHLAPNVNLHRSPLGGRHFECYSEDPVLTSAIAEGFVEGVQEQGVAVTIKHYIGNESETDRMTYDAEISEKTLREVYLPPFEAGVKAGAWSVMAAYNSVDGESMTDNRRLLTEVLKDELGFDGAVVSDWMATRTTAPSANAGLDVVMPGPQGPWGEALVAAVRAGEVEESVVDDKVLRVLRLAARTGYLDGLGSADIEQSGSADVEQSGSADIEQSEDPAPASTPDDAEAQIRDLAARAMVVLRNEDGLLPLDPAALTRVAVIGRASCRERVYHPV